MLDDMIFICSPFGGDEENLAIAELICGKVASGGQIPFAPHVYFPRFMNEHDPAERKQGINWGLQFMPACKEVWIFVHYGISPGMAIEEARALELGKPICLIDWSWAITAEDIEVHIATKQNRWELCFAWRPVRLIDGTLVWLEALKRTRSQRGGWHYARENR